MSTLLERNLQLIYNYNQRCLNITNNIIGEDITKYQVLPYIESTGLQYIDTGVLGKSGLIVILDFEGPTEDENAIFGSGDINDKNRFYAIRYKGNQNDSFYFYYSNTGHNYSSFKDYSNRHLLVCNNNKCYIDNVLYLITYNEINFTSSRSLYLFWCNYEESVWQKAKMKLYSCKIYDNNLLIRDFIPVKRLKDNVICLYDLVTCTFYENCGSGNFIAGGVE